MRRHLRHRRPEAELNITAFMNLMVILVPFLLITAAFSRMAVLDLYLPPAASGQGGVTKELQLEIIIREDAIEVADRRGGLIQRIEQKDDGYDLQRLSDVLQAIKARHPDKKDAFVLSEPEIPYDAMVQVMDRVRLAEVVTAGSVVQAELFPQISLGDAPPPPAAAKTSKRKTS